MFWLVACSPDDVTTPTDPPHATGDTASVVDTPPDSGTSPPLPEGLPPLTVVVSEPSAMEPGETLFAVNAEGVGSESWILWVDEAGQVVRWLHDAGQVLGLAPLADGGLAYLTDKSTLAVVDRDGATVRSWRAGEGALADVPALYHDLVALPDGAFATFAFEVRTVDDYPTSERDPDAPGAPAEVVSTTVVELDEAGIRSTLALADLLDPLRIGYDGVEGNYWDDLLPEIRDPKDWGHGNGLSYDAADDALIVSLRNQDVVAKIARTSHDVLWIVAPEANWRLPWADDVLHWTYAPFGPNYHQHGPNLTASGTLLLFDNGNGRASVGELPTPDAANVSRALEVAVDPVAGTVTHLWQYGPGRPDAPFCTSQGGAEALDATGHVLVTFGQIANAPAGGPTARIVEVDRSGHVFFELGVGDGARAWKVFRALRVPR